MTYWQKRLEALGKTEYLRSDEFSRRVRALYVQALSRIDADTHDILKKMTKNDALSLSMAREYLSKNDLELFRMNVDDYIKLASGFLTPDKIEKLEMASRVHHMTKLQAVSYHLEKEMELLSAKFNLGMTEFLRETYENSFYSGVFSKQTLSGYESIGGINNKRIEQIIKKPWTSDGKVFSDRIWEDKEKLLNKLSSELFDSSVRGEGLGEISKRFAKEMDVSYSNAKRLIHTESAFFTNEAFRESIEGDCDGFEVLGTLDKKTCSECGSMDGKHYSWEEYEVGVTAPPFHPYCRCAIAPWFNDGLKSDTRIARGDDGKSRYVRNMSYEEWKREYVDGVGDNVVEEAIKNGEVKDEINKEKQVRHLKDSHIEGRSFLNGDLDFAKELYSEFKGKGTPIIIDGQWKNKERVNTGRNVAIYDNGDGKKTYSTNIIIVYSKTGSHIIGGRPDES